MIIRSLYKKSNRLLTGLFAIIIGLPLIVSLIENDKVVSQTEKRNLNTLPDFPKSQVGLQHFPALFNSYYSDHFGLREFFTKVYFKIINKIDPGSTSDDVTIGKDGWMFLGSIKPGYNHFGDPMGDVMNTNLFSQKELTSFAMSISHTQSWLNRQGIEYLYVIAPSKHTIYFDKLPDYISKKSEYSATDQLVNYLRENTDIMLIDLREKLIKAKRNQQIYYKTDTHWNYLGANIAQFEIMKIIEEKFPGKITASLHQSKQFKSAVVNNADLARFAKTEAAAEKELRPVFDNRCSQTDEMTDADAAIPYSTFCSHQQLKALIFRDSFFRALQPYFSRKLNKATFIHEKISKQVLKRFILMDKPDIVIDEIVERELPYLPQ